MAATQKKRIWGENFEKVRKRQRVGGVRPPTKSGGAVLKPVSLDQLAWREVTLPDRLDDTEGFFGLEEIEHVEIVRDEESGTVEYRVAANDSDAKPTTNGVSKAIPKDTEIGYVEEEWEGFGNECEVEQESKRAAILNGKQMTKDKPKKKRKKKEKITAEKPVGATTIGNVFDILEEDEDEADVSDWAPLGLSAETLSSLAKLKFSSPTPIQRSAIPEILDGHDVVGKASTGSGKTLAFGIPILEHYLLTLPRPKLDASAAAEGNRHAPIAMILSPTRELAHQISAHLMDLFSNLGDETPRLATLTGGLSLHKQQRLLSSADVIIGTPGRLWEVISSGRGLLPWLRRMKYLILDEADRLLSDGHFKEVEEILNSLDREDTEEGEKPDAEDSRTGFEKTERQILVFSATFQKNLQQKLAGKGRPGANDIMGKQESMEYLLKKLNFKEERPKFIDANPVSQMTSNLREGIVECAGLEKDLYLYSLLMHYPNTRTLIFANSIASVRRLTPLLQNLNVPAHALHSQMIQKARLRSLERFSSPSHPGFVLVATDVAARGLDIPSVQLVVHYHLPRAADMYVHRSGRTARGTNTGSSILLCAPEEVQGVRRLVAKVHARNAVAQKTTKFYMQTIDIDRRVVARLKSRVTLAKKISDASLAKEKGSHEENWLRTAAADLGVDYDSEEFIAQDVGKKGRGQGRKKVEREARAMTKGEVGALKAELKRLLAQRVNVGVSERYLSAGGVDVDELLQESRRGEFLGKVRGLGLD